MAIPPIETLSMALSAEEKNQKKINSLSKQIKSGYTGLGFNSSYSPTPFQQLQQDQFSLKKEKKKKDLYQSERERVRQEDLNLYQARQTSLKNSLQNQQANRAQGLRGAISNNSIAPIASVLGLGGQPKTLLGL